MDKGERMEYRVGDKVRIKSGLNNMHTRCVSVTSRMINKEGAIATIERVDPNDNTYKIEEIGEWWEDEMFEPVDQYSSGGIVLSLKEYGEMHFIPGTIRLVLSDERKNKLGIESRKDIRKRLLNL
jgi:hypothetical protein